MISIGRILTTAVWSPRQPDAKFQPFGLGVDRSGAAIATATSDSSPGGREIRLQRFRGP